MTRIDNMQKYQFLLENIPFFAAITGKLNWSYLVERVILAIVGGALAGFVIIKVMENDISHIKNDIKEISSDVKEVVDLIDTLHPRK